MTPVHFTASAPAAFVDDEHDAAILKLANAIQDAFRAALGTMPQWLAVMTVEAVAGRIYEESGDATIDDIGENKWMQMSVMLADSLVSRNSLH